jgi:hypothetical protein
MNIENRIGQNFGRFGSEGDRRIRDFPLTTPEIRPILNPDPTNPSRPFIYPAIFPARELPYDSIKDIPKSTYSKYWC